MSGGCTETKVDKFGFGAVTFRETIQDMYLDIETLYFGKEATQMTEILAV